MYNGEPVLPVDIKCNLNKNVGNNENPFEKTLLHALFSSAEKVVVGISVNLSCQPENETRPKEAKKGLQTIDIHLTEMKLESAQFSVHKRGSNPKN